MKGPTHQAIGPIFTLGASTYYLTTKQLDTSLALPLMVGVASIASFFTSTWPDADQHSKCKPPSVLLYGNPLAIPFRPFMHVRQVQVSDKGGRMVTRLKHKGKLYSRCRRWDIQLVATFFWLIHARAHRGFLSHSPTLWIPIWFIIFGLTAERSQGLLLAIILGMGFGFISHIVADFFTKECIPFLPKCELIEDVPVIGDIWHFISNIRVFKWGCFKANNQMWNTIVIILIAFVSLSVICPPIGKILIESVTNGLSAILKFLPDIIPMFFKFIGDVFSLIFCNK